MHFCDYYCLNIIVIVNASRASNIAVNITLINIIEHFLLVHMRVLNETKINERGHEVMKSIWKRLLGH